MKRICETLRIVAQTVYNSTPGRERHEMIQDPKEIVKFGWEQVEVQTVEEMRSFIMGLSHMNGTKVLQNGEEVDSFEEPEQESQMKRTK